MIGVALSFIKGLSWKVWAALAVLALSAGTVYYCQEQVEERVDDARELGQTEERNIQLTETLKNVEKADEARETIADPGPDGDNARYNQCLRTDRNPENCKRFLPDAEPTDNGS